MIRGIHHVALHTPDIARLSRFYCDVVGFEVVPESVLSWRDDPTIDAIIQTPGSAAETRILRAGNVYLELFQYHSPPARDGGPLAPSDHGYTHICLDSDDVAADFERLRAGGMRFDHAPFDIGFAQTIYGRDPDGNVVELQQMTPNHAFSMENLPAQSKASAR